MLPCRSGCGMQSCGLFRMCHTGTCTTIENDVAGYGHSNWSIRNYGIVDMRLPVQSRGILQAATIRVAVEQGLLVPLGTCGTGWNEPWVRDTWGHADFTESCRQHDRCYDTCGMGKDDCDNHLLASLVSECESVYPGAWHAAELGACKAIANTYHLAVRRLGGDAYRQSQAAGGCS